VDVRETEEDSELGEDFRGESTDLWELKEKFGKIAKHPETSLTWISWHKTLIADTIL
jgi:hypothetical protein